MARPTEPRHGGRPNTAVDAVLTHHLDGFRSGVARFNEVLAERLAVPLLSIFDPAAGELRNPLLSFKVSEMDADERARLTTGREGYAWHGEVFLHDYTDSELERLLIVRADRVHCGNHEIASRVGELVDVTDVLWSPGLIFDDRVAVPAAISVFSFGMAHKIRTDLFRRLRELLEDTGRSFVLNVSAANHETTRMQDAQLIFEELHEIFPRRLFFLGNLSDVAVFNYLRSSTFFASFFVGGVRANNGSVSAAMEKGAVVITNLDEFSPPEYVHGDNLIDINQCEALPSDPLELKHISVRAIETARTRSWDRFIERLSA